MKRIIIYVTAMLLFFAAGAQQKKPVKVLLLGTFHFANPGLDVAKFEGADILSSKRQAEVTLVVNALKKFAPNKIFIESVPEYQKSIDSAVAAYKAGTSKPWADERYQLAYRLAAELHLPTVYGVDYYDAHFPFDSLMKSAVQAGQTEYVSWVQKTIDSIEKSFNEALKKSTVKQLLLRENTAEAIHLQTEFYFKLLPFGKPGNHIGPYLVSEWWRRNMVIYENILKQLDGKEEKILVLFGSGHTALLHEMMKFNSSIELVSVESILMTEK